MDKRIVQTTGRDGTINTRSIDCRSRAQETDGETHDGNTSSGVDR